MGSEMCIRDSIIHDLESLEKKLVAVASTARITVEEMKKVLEQLEDISMGCTEVCPFCKSQCVHTMRNHPASAEHYSCLHYPQGVGGYRCSETKILASTNCCEDVGSHATFKNYKTKYEIHPYADYRHHYPDWRIKGDRSPECSLMWRRALAKFNDQWAKHHEAKPANVPEEWKSLTKKQVLDAIEKEFDSYG